MVIPVINLEELNGSKRNETMSRLHEACAKWGFFWVEKHGISEKLTGKVKELVNKHYEDNLKDEFYKQDIAKKLESGLSIKASDWESSFFVRHESDSNINGVCNLNENLREKVREYVDQLVTVAETLAQSMSENLGLQSNHIKNAFARPSVGTKVAIYPKCQYPEQVTGLRAHTDAGGIILLLQDDTVAGLEFFKDNEWVPVTPTKKNMIFVNLGDQIEVVSNGVYKSIMHRVLADENGSRLSVATFYNPGGSSVISPASELVLPGGYRFEDYLSFYTKVKFSDKESRFKAFKEMSL